MWKPGVVLLIHGLTKTSYFQAIWCTINIPQFWFVELLWVYNYGVELIVRVILSV